MNHVDETPVSLMDSGSKNAVAVGTAHIKRSHDKKHILRSFRGSI